MPALIYLDRENNRNIQATTGGRPYNALFVSMSVMNRALQRVICFDERDESRPLIPSR